MNEQQPTSSHKLIRRTGALVLLGGAFGAGVIFREPLVRMFSSKAQMADKKDAAHQQLWTCSMHPQVIQDHPGFCPICHMTLTPLSAGLHAATHASQVAATGTVVIDPVVVQRMGVRVATAEVRKLTRTIRLVGELTEPEPDHVDVNLRVSGWIDKLYADSDGKAVLKGEPLFDLYSPELTVAVDELIAGRKQKESSKDASADGFYQATRAKISRMGLGDQQIDELAKLDAAPKAISILSPATGHVTAKTVIAGSAVKAGDAVMKIADRSTMWIELQVYEQDLPYIKVGQDVSVSVTATPGQTYAGKISFVYPHLDMMTRTLRVRLTVPNPQHNLHEGMYASAEIAAVLPEETVVIPSEAIIDTGTRQFTFLWLGEGKFEPRTLTIGASDGHGDTQVLAGLKTGDRVVTSGQFLIDAESRTQEAIQKLLSDRLAEPSVQK